jgi:hypothetical protein
MRRELNFLGKIVVSLLIMFSVGTIVALLTFLTMMAAERLSIEECKVPIARPEKPLNYTPINYTPMDQ